MKRFLRYAGKRLLLLAFILIGLSLITFLLARVVPSDPAASYIGPHPRPEQVAEVRIKLGLNKPLYTQYAYYMRDLLHGDLGTSIRTHRPVTEDIIRFLPASLEIMFTAIIIALIVGILLGVLAAQKENTLIDHSSRLFAVSGVSLPGFWLGLLFQLLFFRWLGVLPLGGRIDTYISVVSPVQNITGFYLIDSLVTGNWLALGSSVMHLILPSIALAAYSTGIITRMTRSTMLEVNREDYVVAARAVGLPERIIALKYTLRNALSPTITTAGLAFVSMLTGTFFIEIIFNWPGLGTYTTMSILAVDHPVIMGVTLIVAIFYVLINLVVDLLQALIDPRIRL
jgi:peptide/nickel transport system permease protein